jgi:alkanesulfonate monooxygenase SsuD/methylene tetrahydromethanopterin reductase-like flavin-dependent oxidoreductase (luciferase family)
MRFGWLTLGHSPSPEEDGAAIDDQVIQACFAETTGFEGIWLTEHNFTGESVYCDPIPFASVVAARTSRIRIGFAVIHLALRHPIRLATQLALLDNLSGGRLDVGVGHGTNYNEYEFVAYGLRSDDSRERMAETLEVMVNAYARFFAQCGFAEEVEAVNAAWKAGDRTGAVKGISARVLDGLGAVGTADLCHEQLDAFARTGVTPVVLPFAPPGPAARASLLRTFRAFP